MASKDTIDILNRKEFFYYDKPPKTPEIEKQDREQTERDFALIRKDLEVLKIIKERFIWLENGKLYCGRINDIQIPIDEDIEGNEEMELLREWLENEKDIK